MPEIRFRVLPGGQMQYALILRNSAAVVWSDIDTANVVDQLKFFLQRYTATGGR